jgi:hypothetical protein
MAKAKAVNALQVSNAAMPTLAQQAAAGPVQAAQQAATVATKPKVLGSRVIGVAGAVGLPTTGNMVLNVAKLQKSAAGYATKGRTSLQELADFLLTLNGKPWTEVAAALATKYPANTALQCYTAGGQAVSTQIKYWAKSCISTEVTK